jgi:hypothetical protein
MSGGAGERKWRVYTALAKEEMDPHRRNALRGLAAAENSMPILWADRIRELGGPEPSYIGDSAGLTSHFVVWKLMKLWTSPSMANSSNCWVTNPVLPSCRK